MRALDGISVVSLGQVYNGPYCSLMLSYLGADVVKVEPPTGENIRSRDDHDFTPEFVMLNSSKRCVTIDFKAEEGKELFKELVAEADVLVENYSAGTMERLGLGYETLSAVNPELVYAHASGYGDEGEYANYPAMDLTIQAMGGVIETTGFPDGPPVKAGIQAADFLGGIHLAAGILAALYQREITGEGQYLEGAMLDAIYPTLMSSHGAHYRYPDSPPRTGNRHSGLARCPYNVYEADDGYVAVICINERQWQALTEIVDDDVLADDERFGTNEKRAAEIDVVDERIEAWTKTKAREDVATVLTDAGVPAAPVRKYEEVLHDPHLEDRGMIQEIDHPEFGSIRVPGLPLKLGSSESPQIRPASGLGEDNESVFADLGLTAEEIRELEADGVI